LYPFEAIICKNRTSLLTFNILELQVRMKFGVVTEVSTFLVLAVV